MGDTAPHRVRDRTSWRSRAVCARSTVTRVRAMSRLIVRTASMTRASSASTCAMPGDRGSPVHADFPLRDTRGTPPSPEGRASGTRTSAAATNKNSTSPSSSWKPTTTAPTPCRRSARPRSAWDAPWTPLSATCGSPTPGPRNYWPHQWPSSTPTTPRCRRGRSGRSTRNCGRHDLADNRRPLGVSARPQPTRRRNHC